MAGLAAEAAIELDARPSGLAVLLDGQDVSSEIRGPDVTNAVSTVAALPAVRQAMIPLQRAFAAAGGMVAEGRDIGTVVFPDADVKFFLDADPAERASRRAAERGERDVQRVQAEIVERDRKDSTRAVAPLKPAEDAVRVDSTHLSLDEVVDLLEDAVRKAAPRED